MDLCEVCKKEFKNLKTHLVRQAKKDVEHKKYLEKLDECFENQEQKEKKYKPGDVITLENKGEFQVVEDLGKKLIVSKLGSTLMKFTIKKERL